MPELSTNSNFLDVSETCLYVLKSQKGKIHGFIIKVN